MALAVDANHVAVAADIHVAPAPSTTARRVLESPLAVRRRTELDPAPVSKTRGHNHGLDDGVEPWPSRLPRDSQPARVVVDELKRMVRDAMAASNSPESD